MKYQFPALIALLALMANACAQSDVYLCIGENGSKEYKNTGAVKGCKKVDVPGLTLIPAPPRHAAPVQTASLHSSSAPADFPRVEPSAQKGRDNERRQILLDELKKEQDQLALLNPGQGQSGAGHG